MRPFRGLKSIPYGDEEYPIHSSTSRTSSLTMSGLSTAANISTESTRRWDPAVLLGNVLAVGTVISFPHGDSTTEVKVAEADRAMADGAVELDMVLNIGWLLSGEYQAVEDDIKAVVEGSGEDALVKVILENAYLSDEQKVIACRLVEAAGGDYVKTSTGYAPTGATLEDLRLMRATVSPHVKVKAAHGVRTLDALLAVIEAGADRCGATATAAMLDDYRKRTSATKS